MVAGLAGDRLFFAHFYLPCGFVRGDGQYRLFSLLVRRADAIFTGDGAALQSYTGFSRFAPLGGVCKNVVGASVPGEPDPRSTNGLEWSPVE